ncbi:hypothetical protein CQW23_30611 [Capsicum baccatum]|uniref:Uncharacterized protein n=1 Tax=Capsicum baccatum TaxID=33114 RepID=A0A2G2V9V7_CAPBA|nr:hypothetical protein CQW23_30611 [Capsicum baccatum]
MIMVVDCKEEEEEIEVCDVGFAIGGEKKRISGDGGGRLTTYMVFSSSTGNSRSSPSSLYSPVIYTISETAEAILLYSDSAELLEMVVCFLDFQDMRESPCLTRKPVTDFLVFGHAAQSASKYAVSLFCFLLLINIPIAACLLMYLTTLSASSM